MRAMTVIRVVVVLVVALVVTAVAVLMSIDFGGYKGEIAAAVREATGRQLDIDGKFSLRIGLTPRVEVERVRFANAPWGSRPAMATIEKFGAEVKLLPLIFGEVRVERLVLEGADILLETDAQGRGNWMFAPEVGRDAAAPPQDGGAARKLPSFDRVRVERARIVWRDGASGRADEVTVNTLEALAESTDQPVRLALRAIYGGAPVSVDGTLGPLVRLAGGTNPWPFEIEAVLGSATIALKGAAQKPLAGTGIEADLSVRGGNLSDLAALAGGPLPAIGPYRVEARLAEKDGRWTASNLSLSVGTSTLSGEASIEPSATPPKLHASLAGPVIDLADFQDGKAPAATGRVSPAAGAAEPLPPPVGDAAAGRLFSDAPLPLAALGAVDATVAVRTAKLVLGTVALTDATVDLRISDGRLAARPVKASLAGAPLTAEIQLGGSQGPPALVAKLGIDKLDLAALLKEAGQPGLASGKVDIRADLNGKGQSIRALMAGIDGTAELVMGSGTIADDTLDLLSADVIKAISPWAPKNRDLKVNCVVGRYDIRAGMATSRMTLFDSDRVALTGEGGVNLATEEIGLTVVPYAKEASLLRLAVPIRIGGTLAEPRAWPDAERIAKGAVGTVLGLPGDVLGTLGNVLRGGGGRDGEQNRCLAALKAGGDRMTPPSSRTSGPAGELGRAIEGIGKGIGDGLKNLFGK